MTRDQLAIATSTVWVILAAILVMFMQAGFAFLEAGLTRMKNVGHIAAKNVLIFALASVIYCCRIRPRVRRWRQRLRRRLRFMPSTEELSRPSERHRSRGSGPSRPRRAICSRSCSAPSRSRSCGVRWPSA